MRRRPRTILAALLAGSALSLAVAAGAPAASRTYADDCNHLRYRPAGLTLSCSDGVDRLLRMRWSRWTAGSAYGSGRAQYNTCDPSCGLGGTRAYVVRVFLGAPIHCGRWTMFSYARIRFVGERPRGSSGLAVWRFAC